MDGLLNLLPLYCDQGDCDLHLNEFLQACRTHQTFSENYDQGASLNHVLSIVNSKLNNPHSRVIGALILDSLVDQCGTVIFTDHCVSWTQQVVKLLTGPDKMENGPVACSVLSKLIAFSSQFPEPSRQLGQGIVSQLASLLCNEEFRIKPYLAEQSLQCLKMCMKHYGSSCGQAKLTIERHLLSFVDLKGAGPGSVWSECLAIIPQLGGSGPQGTQFKANWTQLCSQLLNAAHSSLDKLLRNVSELKTISEDLSVPLLKLPDLQGDNPLENAHSEKRRVLRLLLALSQLIRQPFPAAKNIPIGQTMALITRIVNVNTPNLLKNSQADLERVTLACLIPEVHSGALDLLVILCTVCRTQLIPLSQQVANIFVQTLSWTHTPRENRRRAVERPYSKLRCQAYEGLVLWMTAARSACALTKHADQLVSEILSDATVERDIVQIEKASMAPVKKSDPKKKSQPELIDRKCDSSANSNTCHASLHCLSSLLLHLGPRLSAGVHKDIQQHVLSIAAQFANFAPAEQMLLPYNDRRCRGAIYRLLERLNVCSSPYWPVPLQYSMELLAGGLNDPSVEVAGVCAEVLASLEALVRPRGPALTPPESGNRSGRGAVEKTQLEHKRYAEIEQRLVGGGQIPLRMPEESPLIGSGIAAVAGVVPGSKVNVQVAPKSDPVVVRSESKVNVQVAPRTDNMVLMNAGVVAGGAIDAPVGSVAPAEAPAKDPPRRNDPAEATDSRKRRSSATEIQDSKKVASELSYGMDAEEDDLDSMLASFRDTPAID